MKDKFLKSVVSSVVGKSAEDIVDLINIEKHANEFQIAKKMNLTINQTRNILYKLSDYGLVSSIRKKDKKKGWYTYFWKIETLKSLNFLREIISKRTEQIKKQINNRETKIFYICERCNLEFSEETALMNNFTCNECGEILKVRENEKMLKDLNKILSRLEKDLELIDKEINIEKEKLEKKKAKEQKKEEKEKEKKKLEKKKERERLKKQKNVTKKEIKKKSPKKKSLKKRKVKSSKKKSLKKRK